MRVEELETPIPVIDLDRVEHNLAKMQAHCDSYDLRLRPHIKTQKRPLSHAGRWNSAPAALRARSSARPR